LYLSERVLFEYSDKSPWTAPKTMRNAAGAGSFGSIGKNNLITQVIKSLMANCR